MNNESAAKPTESKSDELTRLIIFVGRNKVITDLITEHGEIFPHRENIRIVVLRKVPKRRIPRFSGQTLLVIDLSYDVLVGDELRQRMPLGNCAIEELRYPIGGRNNSSLSIKKELLLVIEKYFPSTKTPDCELFAATNFE